MLTPTQNPSIQNIINNANKPTDSLSHLLIPNGANLLQRVEGLTHSELLQQQFSFRKARNLTQPEADWDVLLFQETRQDSIDTTVLQYNQLSTILSNPTPEDVEDAHFGNVY